MSYVRIPDPNIIDLAAWHQVISVVNQHSDSLAAITNDFGANYERVEDEASGDYSVQYDVSSQKIIYGRARLLPSDSNTDNIVWYESISFLSPFSARPVVTATILAGNNATKTRNKSAIVSVYKLTENGFSYRVLLPDPTAYQELDQAIWGNWIAIGPR